MPIKLTNPRVTVLLANIAATPALASLPKTTQAANTISAAYEQDASPDVWVWKSSVTKAEVLEMVHHTDLGLLTAANRELFGLYLLAELVPCDRQRVRNFFANIFSGATQNTNTRLDALFKRRANAGEALYASNGSGGDGSQGAPFDLGKNAEGVILPSDVEIARGV